MTESGLKNEGSHLKSNARFAHSGICGFIGTRMPEFLHRTLFLHGPAGRLEAFFLAGAENRNGGPPLAAVVCHPHPLFGGTMHNKVVYQAAKTLHRFALPVVRFNFRGVGLSGGTR